MFQSLLIALLGFTLLPPGDDPAPAASPKKRTPETAFHKRDKNGDNALSQEEFDGPKVKDFDKSKARFAKLDADKDGKLSLTEFKAGVKARTKGKVSPAKTAKAEAKKAKQARKAKKAERAKVKAETAKKSA